MTSRGTRNKSVRKYRRRKVYFWIILLSLILLSIGIYLFFFFKTDDTKKLIRAGVCGAVKQPAVYTIQEGADLSSLIRLANGITADADINDWDLDEVIENDTIYHIPARGDLDRLNNFYSEVKDLLTSHMDLSYSGAIPQDKLKQYSVLYVGLPTVYMLINYYPTLKKIDVVYIPHSTLLMMNDYRIVDILFTLDINYTIRLLENKLKQKIDRYVIQDRSGFVDMIDALGGIDVSLDKSYADAYNLKQGINNLNGFHTWEYIRYIDMKSIKVSYTQGKDKDLIRHDNFEADPSSWQQIYNTRLHRQELVLHAMYNMMSKLRPEKQIDFVQKFPLFVRTNMNRDFLLSMYKDITAKPQIHIGILPGYYSNEGDKLFYHPDIPSYDLLLHQKIRESLTKPSDREQVIY